MKIFCHNCQSTISISNYNNSSSVPKCPNCRSQAVQLINQQQHQVPPIQRVQRQRNIRQNPFGLFQEMQRMMNRRNMHSDIFEEMRDRSQMRGMGIQKMFPMMERTRMMNTMQMPQFQQEQEIRRNPMIYRRIIRSPNGSTYIFSNIQGDSLVEQNNQQVWEPHQHLYANSQKKPKVSDFTHVSKLTQECSICNSKEGQGVSLPCSHKFHKECLEPWFQVKDNCPCCRIKL